MPDEAARRFIGPGEIRSLTGLRIIAAMWVVVFHFHFTPGDAYTRFWEPFRPFVESGQLGVDMFYVLSGFVITLTYLEKVGPRLRVRSTVTFLWARLCRIWPVYAVITTVFGAWLLIKSTRVSDGYLAYQTVQPQLTVWSYVKQLFMVQLWDKPFFDGSSFVGPAWSISAEWSAYVCFPLLALVIFRVRKLPAPVLAALAVAAMVPFAYLSYTGQEGSLHFAWLLRIGCGFAAGAFTYLAVRNVEVDAPIRRLAPLVTMLALVEIVIGILWSGWRAGGGGYAGVIVVVFPVLVGSLALHDTGIAKFLSTTWMVHGGRISYSLYLVHIPVFEIFWFAMTRPALAPGTALATFLIPQVLLLAVVLGHLCYAYIEEPARVWLRRKGPRSATERLAPVPVAAGP
jgi:peptidoglycan/LPS O-acetylase OafA/YrhL